jgi:hypothetical protein
MGRQEATMTDYSDYDGPPAWWTARLARAEARRPLCDEYGTPLDDEGEADDEDTDNGEGEE